MDREKENSVASSTLPRPELNPMLNPLLGQNMGRWAEVYYTSTPEKREEAVLELLRQLEAEAENAPLEENPQRPAQREMIPPETETPVALNIPAEHTPESVPQNTEQDFRIIEPEEIALSDELEDFPQLENTPDDLHSQPASEAPTVAAEESHPAHEPYAVKEVSLRCARCGHENPATNSYCGLCGVALEKHSAPDVQPSVGQRRQPEPWAPEPAAFPREPVSTAEPELLHHRRSPLDQEPSRSYRSYVIVALLVLLFVLGYMGWRSGQAARGSRGKAAPSGAAIEQRIPMYSPPLESVVPAGGSQQKETAQPATPAIPNRSVPMETDTSQTESSKKPSVRQDAVTKEPIAPPPAIENAQAPLGTSNGAAELATAEQYLNGSDGAQRNSAEAAQWLWKSIANKNGQAMLQLADLYLKGDGVSKNCDQARVLLDSAARKGVAGAGERLRNLAAFGCQ